MIVENQLTHIPSENINTAAILIRLQISKKVHQTMDYGFLYGMVSCTVLQSDGLQAGHPVRSDGLGAEKLGGAGLKNGGFGGILEDFGGF